MWAALVGTCCLRSDHEIQSTSVSMNAYQTAKHNTVIYNATRCREMCTYNIFDSAHWSDSLLIL